MVECVDGGIRWIIKPLLYIFMFAVVLFVVCGISLIAWVMVKSNDYLMDDEIDVDDNDFLTMAGRDGWDDNAINSEGDF